MLSAALSINALALLGGRTLGARDAGIPRREAGRLTGLAISVDVGTGADCVVRRAGLLVATRFEAASVVGAGSVLELTRARLAVRVVVGAGAGASTGADCVWVRGIVSRVSNIRLVQVRVCLGDE